MYKCDKFVCCNMTAEEQRLSAKRSEYAFVTIMNKYKKKMCVNIYIYMAPKMSGLQGSLESSSTSCKINCLE
jgi:hypothetical protein